MHFSGLVIICWPYIIDLLFVFVLGNVFAKLKHLFRVDIQLQENVQNLIDVVWKNFSSAPEIIIGGSTVEGAMVARYFKPLEEVEFDLNYLIGDLPRNIVEPIEDKKGKVKIRLDDEFYEGIKKDSDRHLVKSTQHNTYLNTFKIKESLMGGIALRNEEIWMKVSNTSQPFLTEQSRVNASFHSRLLVQ